MNQLIIMDRSGDQRIDLKDDVAVSKAKAQFDEFVNKRRYIASEKKTPESERTLTRKFDPEAYQTLLQPQYIGG